MESFKRQQASCRCDPMVIHAALVNLARIRSNCNQIGGETEILNQTERIREEVRRKKVKGGRTAATGSSCGFENGCINSAALQSMGAGKPGKSAANNRSPLHVLPLPTLPLLSPQHPDIMITFP